MRSGVASLAAGLGALAIVVSLATACQLSGLSLEALPGRAVSSTSAGAGPTPAVYEAIREAAVEETHGDMHIERIDYIGRHDNGSGAVGYIFYVYFFASATLHYQPLILLLPT